MVEYRKFITRKDLRAEPDTLFVFGDNVAGTGYGGQAREMRGEPNAVGIPTKWIPTNEPEAFFYDFQFIATKKIILDRIKVLLDTSSKIVWPSDGIGTGLARLDKTSPLAFDYIEQIRRHLEINH